MNKTNAISSKHATKQNANGNIKIASGLLINKHNLLAQQSRLSTPQTEINWCWDVVNFIWDAQGVHTQVWNCYIRMYIIH